MKAIGFAIFICSWSYFLLIPAYCQDRDKDGINDALESQLALQFAPEWRFHYQITDDRSTQNHNEVAFPSSVEWFFQEVAAQTRELPRLRFQSGSDRIERAIPDIDILHSITDPYSGQQADSEYWTDKVNSLRIVNFPEWIGGDPDNFPTYFHCTPYDSETIGIEYYLWFPYDYTGNYEILGIDIEIGEHRGDWEGINVIVKNPPDLNSRSYSTTPDIVKIVYYGHHVKHGKEVYPGSLAFNVVEETHPQAFVGWGAHPMYPEAGEWHNARVGIDYVLSDTYVYDDFFHGNGLVVESWKWRREMINLGEYDPADPSVSFKKWIRFKGLWGEDGDESNGSPKSPPFRGRWGPPETEYHTKTSLDWEEIKHDYKDHTLWIEPFEGVTKIAEPGGFNSDYPNGVVLAPANYWRQEYVTNPIELIPPIFLEPGEYATVPDIIHDRLSSIFLRGQVRVTLYEHENFGGAYFVLDHSCPDLGDHRKHGFEDKVSSLKIENIYLPARPTPIAISINDAWVELFEHRHFEGRSLMLRFSDGDIPVYDDFEKYATFGDRASSVRFLIPEGDRLRLFEHDHQHGEHHDLHGKGEIVEYRDFDLWTLSKGGKIEDTISSAEWIPLPGKDNDVRTRIFIHEAQPGSETAGVRFYTKTGFEGIGQSIDHECKNIIEHDHFHGLAASLELADTTGITLYSLPDYSGETVYIDHDCPNLAKHVNIAEYYGFRNGNYHFEETIFEPSNE